VQLETASQLSRQMLDDIQKLNALGLQFKEELDTLAADGIKKSTGKA
jgi:phasin family protein